MKLVAWNKEVTAETTLTNDRRDEQLLSPERQLAACLIRLAPRLTSSRLRELINKRLGALLRISGVKLQLIPASADQRTQPEFSSNLLKIPVSFSDGEHTVRLRFTLTGISNAARMEILSTAATILDDLLALPVTVPHTDTDDLEPATSRGTVIHLSEDNLEVKRCSAAATRDFGLRPGMLLGREISSEECSRHLEAFLAAANPAEPKQRRRFTMRRGAAGNLDVELEVIARSNGEFICALNRVTGNDGGQRGHLPPQVPERLVHRLRNPLTTIMSCCSQLLDTSASQIDSTDRTLVKWISTAADVQNTTINRYLQLYGFLQSAPRRAKLNDVLKAVLAENENKYADRVEVTGLPESAPLVCDIYLLKQILVEILDNAIEASSTEMVSLAVRIPEDQAVLTIENHVANPTNSAKRCYEPFYTTKSGHSGLGLPIAVRYASLLGGCVDLKLEQDRAVARIVFPLIQKEKANLHIEERI